MSNDTKTEVLDILNLINQGINSAKVSNEVLLNLTTNDYIEAGKNLAQLAINRENNKHFLKKVANVTLPACGAGRSLAQAADKFPGFHDKDLKNLDLDEIQKPAGELKLSVYEMQNGKDGNSKKIFKSLKRPLQDLVINQNRIEQFVDLHKNLLHPNGGGATLFLIKRKSDNKLFVVRVKGNGGMLKVILYDFDSCDTWIGEYSIRVVVAEENQ